MSSLINLLSDRCVNFEKCGDVVVSPKDNMIGVFCHFCCDIFKNLLEFLHHLQNAHSDVLAFTKSHNVYSMEQLMSVPDRSLLVLSQEVQLQADCSNSSNDSGVPADAISAASDDVMTALSENILNALAAYDVQCDNVNEPTDLIENELKVQDKELVYTKDQYDVISTVTETPFNSTVIKLNHTEKQLQTAKLNRNTRIQEAGKRNKFIKKQQSLCNPKSYAIARSARKREQQQRLSSIKRRIICSLRTTELCQFANLFGSSKLTSYRS